MGSVHEYADTVRSTLSVCMCVVSDIDFVFTPLFL